MCIALYCYFYRYLSFCHGACHAFYYSVCSQNDSQSLRYSPLQSLLSSPPRRLHRRAGSFWLHRLGLAGAGGPHHTAQISYDLSLPSHYLIAGFDLQYVLSGSCLSNAFHQYTFQAFHHPLLPRYHPRGSHSTG